MTMKSSVVTLLDRQFEEGSLQRLYGLPTPPTMIATTSDGEQVATLCSNKVVVNGTTIPMRATWLAWYDRYNIMSRTLVKESLEVRLSTPTGDKIASWPITPSTSIASSSELGVLAFGSKDVRIVDVRSKRDLFLPLRTEIGSICFSRHTPYFLYFIQHLTGSISYQDLRKPKEPSIELQDLQDYDPDVGTLTVHSHEVLKGKVITYVTKTKIYGWTSSNESGSDDSWSYQFTHPILPGTCCEFLHRDFLIPTIDPKEQPWVPPIRENRIHLDIPYITWDKSGAKYLLSTSGPKPIGHSFLAGSHAMATTQRGLVFAVGRILYLLKY
ncbi:hypothetical protein GMRT_14096 [Giardia muris]|uniref:Uncharacterized protein n=1 Tax=Giardia muris TaxID=5742 RepID=A0A4Z1SXA9_GIAMU|nr:hypothetical protein GMRT_14096 [Giardia muris]|eukprot:TNJ30422.1 hypothetical protein GMRT_14096 [Giardia muris]